MTEYAGHYDHDVRVRFAEGLINRANDWQWLIDCTEECFEGPEEISSVREFLGSFSSVHDPYIFLASIVDTIDDVKLSFSTSWLEKLYKSVLLCRGLIQPEGYAEHVGFYGLLGVASYATCLFNKFAGTNHLFDSRPLFHSNLHQLFDFTALHDDWERLEKLAEKVDLPGIENVVETLRGNFEGINRSVDGDRVKKLMDANFDADFMSFKYTEKDLFQTWQEALLCDALGTSFGNGGVEPMMRFRDGSESPDVSGWTEDMLLCAKNIFDDDRAVCVLEVIELAKWQKTPSKCSQELLVDLSIEYTKQNLDAGEPAYTLRSTAFNVLEYLIARKMLDREVIDRYHRSMAELLGKLTEYNDICFMQSHSLPMSKAQKELFRIKSENYFRDGLGQVASAHGLATLYRNPLSAKYCSQKDAERSLGIFFKFADKADVAIADLFYAAMLFFIDALDNPNIDNEWARKTITTLRHVWQNKYYSQVISQMQVVSTEISAPKEHIDALNEEFKEAPHMFAHSLMLGSDDTIAKTLEGLSDNILAYAVNRVAISEFYPDQVHVKFKNDEQSIDKMIADEAERVYKERSYRLLNQLSEQTMLDGFFPSFIRKFYWFAA